MILIQELLALADIAVLSDGMRQLEEQCQALKLLSAELLAEGAIDNHNGALEREFDDVEKRLIAARRALGVLNTAKLPPDQARLYKSKVMSNINIFRNKLYDIMKHMGMSGREIEYHLHRIDTDRKLGAPSEVFTHTPPTKAQFQATAGPIGAR